MARRTFFSFHYERDIWRTSRVRNSWVTKEDRKDAGFWDAASWEDVKKKGEDAIKKWINEQLKDTSVTVALIGAETSNRDYVKYELKRSWEKGNGILGIYIHQMKDSDGKTDKKGDNSFGPLFTRAEDDKKYFFERFKTYDWVSDDGYKNIGDWIENAAKEAGR